MPIQSVADLRALEDCGIMEVGEDSSVLIDTGESFLRRYFVLSGGSIRLSKSNSGNTVGIQNLECECIYAVRSGLYPDISLDFDERGNKFTIFCSDGIYGMCVERGRIFCYEVVGIAGREDFAIYIKKLSEKTGKLDFV